MLHCKQIWSLLLLVLIVVSCKNTENTDNTSREAIPLTIDKDTLSIGTIYSSTGYFLYRDEYMGYDYELAQALADYLGLPLKLTVADSETALISLLANKEIDIAAYDFYENNTLKKNFQFIMPQEASYQVLVQKLSINTISAIPELENKKIHIKQGSIFEKRIYDLQNETGGIFEIVEVPDSIPNEDLIEMVASGKIDMTVAHYKTAKQFKNLYKNIDIRMPVSYNQRNGWLVNKSQTKLQDRVNEWKESEDTQDLIKSLSQKYLIKSPFFAQKQIKTPQGAISPYDHLFRKFAPQINWDWKLLAAVAYHESQFDSTQVSWAGARGIMQLMPGTAASFGLTGDDIMNPEKNIEAGVQYIKSLNMMFSKIEDKEERLKFILAAYNSGPAHIFDGRALANKYGKNPDIWFGHVEYYVSKKSEPEFYNDSVVKYGKFKAKETITYVKNTLNTYYKYSNR